jgi:metallophosphoesterase (TIGR00282 family)
MSDTIKILCIGDIVGKPGRRILKQALPMLQREHKINVTIANIENAAGGFGVTIKAYDELKDLDIQVFTSGNHIYDKRDIMTQFAQIPKVIRPLNFTEKSPGDGFKIITFNTFKIAVVNIIGRVFMNPTDCPFRAIQKHLEALRAITPIIIVDFHAETTSEKQAMGWFLDGKVSTVFGTHTHVATADERLLDQGTAYITDIGMTGAKDGILGMERGAIIEKFLTQLPAKFQASSSKKKMINGIIVTVDRSGKAVAIERLYYESESLA